MKISVAMATYNGEKYIKEQIESILFQTINVDEIIISDDGSSDATLSIIRELDDPRIIIYTDNENHGYCGNFEHALKHASGDIVFLADQDDLWMPDKVERHIEVFNEFPDIQLIISNGLLINETGALYAQNELAADEYFNSSIKMSASGKLKRSEYIDRAATYCLSNGMCMCLTKEFKTSILPFPDSKTIHDRWIGFCGMNNDSVYYIHTPLVKYRLHSSNTSIQKKFTVKSINKKYIARALRSAYHTPFDMHNTARAMLNRLDPKLPDNPNVITKVQEILNYQKELTQALQRHSILGSIKIFKLYRSNTYYRHVYGKKEFLCHLYLACFGKRFMRENKRGVAE